MTNRDRGRRYSPLNHEPEAVEYAIKRSGMTKRSIAEQVGISASLLTEICKGTRNIQQDHLASLASVLNIPVVMLESKCSHTADAVSA